MKNKDVTASEATNHHNAIVIIYDGQCRFCIASLGWLQQKLSATAIPFQEASLEKYSLTLDQCSKEVFAIGGGRTYAGADAIAHLLKMRGNRLIARMITTFAPLSRFGYRWVASHRNSILIRIITKILERSNARN
jgi:predicted DCC family thiol-disulfide oxidoreductase YuxK